MKSHNKTAPTLRSLDMPRLVVERPDGKEVHHHLSGEEVTIGRDPSNRITIPDNFISKFHAKILINETSLVLVDLQSANKTYVNDRPISEAPLRYGDRIRFAAVHCRLEAPESHAKQAAAAAPPPSPSAPKPEAPKAPPKPGPPPKAPPKPATPPSSRAPADRPAAKKPSAAPPPVEADPMKRLLRIGGLLILVSLALAILLRVLLVPSQVEEVSEDAPEASTGSESATPPATDTSPTPTPTTPAPVTPTAAAENRDAEYYFDEGLAHLDTGRLREARESFERALELDPDHSRARTRLSLLEEEIEIKLKRHFDNARQAFQFLRYEEAIAEWEMFLQLANESDPRYAEAQQGIQQAQAKLR